MEKIIDVSALTDQLKILLWDRSKTREELAERVIGLIEEAGEEIVRCRDCKRQTPYDEDDDCVNCRRFGVVMRKTDFCVSGERRDSE